jgi:hypothetical protein
MLRVIYETLIKLDINRNLALTSKHRLFLEEATAIKRVQNTAYAKSLVFSTKLIQFKIVSTEESTQQLCVSLDLPRISASNGSRWICHGSLLIGLAGSAIGFCK